MALGAALAVGGMLAALSLLRYDAYNVGMLDLGNMAQAIWSAGHGRPLEFTFKEGNLSRLALHVEAIYFLIAPLYRLWPDPRLLLMIQVALFTLGALPVYRLALRHIGSRGAARALMLSYLLYPVAQTAVLFDFHGDTLAMPLLLLAVEALDRRAWRPYALWLTLALSCKLYVGIAVAALGALIGWRGQRRVGGVTALVGLTWTAVAFLVVRPLFASPQMGSTPATGLGYLAFYFGALGRSLPFTVGERLLNAVVVFGPALVLGRFAPSWFLPAITVVLPVLLSTGPGPVYDYRYHHYALAVPFLVAALVYGAVALRRSPALRPSDRRGGSPPWRGRVFLTLAVVAIFNAGLVDTPLSPLFWVGMPGRGLDPWAYGRTSRDALKDRWVPAHVPPDLPLAVSTFLAPRLVNRPTLYLVRYRDEPPDPASLRLARRLDEVAYALPDALFDYAVPVKGAYIAGGVTYDLPAITLLLRDPAFGLVAARDGLLLFQRHPPAGRRLEQRVELIATDPSHLQARFGEAVGLVEAKVEPLGGRRFRLRYDWVALGSLADRPPLLAVSRLEGVDGARIVHLPTLALHPTTAWQPGQGVRETFEVRLPDEVAPGRYPLLVGWYDSSSPFAAFTDARSRVGDEVVVGTISVDGNEP
ncbi:MAG: DUF2079 domain-containing protein [Chloroflexi bacterium]|nr:MAG: DUF2079 domain-containing protein [Chloroflexota bacterium]